ncbi:T9SS type A sorting domain-containing protein [bacterium]|nr:T9SS type A sorting domain-containing protein [bacterium]
MKPRNRHTCIIICFIMMAIPLLSANRDIDEIRRAIQAKGAQWTAGENWVTRLSKEERRALCGAILEPEDVSNAPQAHFEQVDLPEKIDWRDNNGNWITPVKSQGCGDCWNFAAIAQIEAWWKIFNANPDSMIDLSEQFILSCGNAGSCNGGEMWDALEFYQTVGVPSEDCMPYDAVDTVSCANACANWQNEAVTIPGWGWVTLGDPHVGAIKQAVFRAPVSAAFRTYYDWDYYTEGVYEHVWGEYAGDHAILIIGWDDTEQSWICKNSWGPLWGDNGYFRIRWGDCGLGSYATCIWNDVIEKTYYSVSIEKEALILSAGDSTDFQLTIRNKGFNALECTIVDICHKVLFHPDTFMSYDGMSLWCGDPDLGGYPDDLWENLDTPMLNLSGTVNPRLEFMAQWATELPRIYNPFDGRQVFDGRDGCNVWISDDGGKNFMIIEPSMPYYDCTNLMGFYYLFYLLEQPIPGWMGFSNGWIPAEFDLSAYASDSVIIRFSFVSDKDRSTITQPDLVGFFIDEIQVIDNEKILYENHGDELNGMNHSGTTWYARNDWFGLGQYHAFVVSGDSIEIPIQVRTHLLEPGTYFGNIVVSVNDITHPKDSCSFSLMIEPVAHDIAMKSMLSPGKRMPILCPIRPTIQIKNIGQNTEAGFGLILQVKFEGVQVYSDTAFNLTLASKKSMTVSFNPLVLDCPADYDFKVYSVDLPEDNNLLNNQLESQIAATNLVENFESEPVLWTIEGEWRIEDSPIGYEYSPHCAFISAKADSDAILIFNPKLDFSLVDEARIQYWIRSASVVDKQICYFEISTDSLNWTKADSVTGNLAWDQRQIDLTPSIRAGHEGLWFRFYYHTREVKKRNAFWIDNIEIYPESPTDIAHKSVTIPCTWKLVQNYPNPFNPVTNIQYTLPTAAHVEIRIFNALGQQVASLIDKRQTAGVHHIQWDGSGFPSGLYFYRIQAGEFCDTKKCLLLK